MLSELQRGTIPRFWGRRASGLLRGAGAFFLVHVGGTGITLVAHALLARGLGVDAYGDFATALTWLAVLLLGATLGFDIALVRFLPQYAVAEDWPRFAGLVRSARRVVLLAGVVMGLLTTMVVAVLASRLEAALTTTLFVVALLLPLQARLVEQQAELRGLKRVVLGQVPVGLLRPAVLMILGGVIYLSEEGTWGAHDAMVAHGIALLAALWLGGILLARHLPREVRGVEPRFENRTWLRVSVPLFLVSGMRMLLNQVDILLVALLMGTTSAGIYAVASRVARLMSFGLVAGNVVVSPMIAELYSKRRFAELQRVATITSWIGVVSSCAIGIVLVLGQSLALRAFGADFEAGAGVLLILAVGQLANATTGPVGHLLNMTGHQDANARIFGIVTVLNALLNWPAILWWGMEGAAIVTAGMIVLKAVWTWVEARRCTGIQCSIFPLPLRPPEQAP